jgi:hypothetical protein
MRPVTLLPAVLMAAALALPPVSGERANVLISIDKSTKRMSISVDGAPRYSRSKPAARQGVAGRFLF